MCLQCRLHLSENKMSAMSIPARSLRSGQAWLADVTLASDVISCRSHGVEKGRLAFFWARAGGDCIGAGCRAPKCCVTRVGAVAGLWQGSLWRGHWHLCCELGLRPISVQLVGGPPGCPGSASHSRSLCRCMAKAGFAGLQEPVLFPHLASVPGITQPLNTDASPGLEGRGDTSRWHRGRGVGSCKAGHALGAVWVVGAVLVIASTSWTGDESAGSQCSRRTDAAMERRLCWQISPCGSNLKLLLPPVKILPASDALHVKIQRACLTGKCLIQGREEGCGE